MSDHRDDEAPDPGPDPAGGGTPADDDGGVAPSDAEADGGLEIQEMTPPPPGDDDVTAAVPTDAPPESPADAVDDDATAGAPPPPDTAAPPPPSPAPPPPPAAEPAPAAAVAAPPVPPTGEPDPVDGGRSWPTSAKSLVAILLVLAIAGVIGTIVGFSRASSAEDDVDATGTELASERERADAAESEVDELGEALIDVTQERDELLAERAELVGERDQAIAERDEAVAVGEAEASRLQAENDELRAENEELQELLGDLDELFPLEFQLDLGELDIAGTYAVSLTEIGCSGFDELCGSVPSVGNATISNDRRLTIPDTLDVPLTVVEGTPFGAADDETIVPPCGETPRTTSLTMALFDDAVAVDADGDARVTALGATIVIDAPATEECGIGRVWYRAELTPT